MQRIPRTPRGSAHRRARSPRDRAVMCKTIAPAFPPGSATLAERAACAGPRGGGATRHAACNHAWFMMNTVRDTFSSIGDRSSDLARSFGHGTADLARRVGDGTADLARAIGPRRALIGLAVAAVAIGGTIAVMRYLRARRERERLGIESDDYPASGRIIPSSEPLPSTARSPF